MLYKYIIPCHHELNCYFSDLCVFINRTSGNSFLSPPAPWGICLVPSMVETKIFLLSRFFVIGLFWFWWKFFIVKLSTEDQISFEPSLAGRHTEFLSWLGVYFQIDGKYSFNFDSHFLERWNVLWICILHIIV